jgi:hypothetical protein
MAVQTNNPNIAILAAMAIVAYRCIGADGNHTDVDTTMDVIGVSQEHADAGDDVAVRRRQAGTCKATLATSCARGDVLYKAADGKLGTSASGSVAVAIALEAGSGDGSIIEVDFTV